MTSILIISFAVMIVWMSALWLYATKRGEADIVDAGWAAGIGIIAALTAFLGTGDPIRRTILALLVGLWSVRLTLYITQRAIAPGEDGRYAALRASWGASATAKFFLFFQMQGALVAILSLPFIAVAVNSRPFGSALDLLAILLSLVSVVGETTADRQLARFRNNPNNRGLVCEYGLWRYSRHPNYFFEWFHWLAYIPLAYGSDLFIISPLSAIMMLFLILKVTGIPPTEARALESRGDAYRRYQQQVSAFVPWFRKM
jgi:steroid 5-alpha reductase family enzyme